MAFGLVVLILLGTWLRARRIWRRARDLATSTNDLAAMAGVVMFEADRAGRLLWVAGAADGLLGQPARKLVGRTFRQIRFSPDVLTPGGPGVSRSRLVAYVPDGSARSLEVTYRGTADGTVTGILASAEHALTYEHALAEAEVRLVEEDGSALRALLATAQNGMALVRSDGHATLANAALRQLIGLDDAPDGDLNVLSFASRGSEDLLGAIEAAVGGGRSGTRLEIVIRTAARTEREVVASVSPYSIRGEVAGALVEMADVTDERLAVREIERLAESDDLTGLPNRPHFERLVRERIRSGPEGQPFALLLLDLDRFKTVNDSLGHSAGDRLLITMSQRLSTEFGDQLALGRFGGDEFLALVPNMETLDEARSIADGIQRVLASPIVLDAVELNLGASVGVAVYPWDGEDFETLVRHADLAMYRAKRRGGGTFQFANPKHDGDLRGQIQLESALRRALERDEFEIHYQPQFMTETLRIRGVEALLRWNSPEFGLVLPDKFIASLEDSGLIVEVGTFVLREACAEMARWRSAGLQIGPISVNVAARQLLMTEFAEQVRSILDATQLEPHLLELEVTETAGLEHLDEAVEALEELRAEGVQVAIDDFGTGHSSLARLKALPVDTLKLDRSFIADMENTDGRALVGGMIGLGHALGMSIVAEGVETAEQLAVLRELGCDALQGFLFAAAAPPEVLAREPLRQRVPREFAA
jgi:diguanylate cyclase (GGDEF)-like protein/PAS domain S-box-containing protein